MPKRLKERRMTADHPSYTTAKPGAGAGRPKRGVVFHEPDAVDTTPKKTDKTRLAALRSKKRREAKSLMSRSPTRAPQPRKRA